MKTVILCGGRGSRLGIDTNLVPKPMVKIDRFPIVVHIMNYYFKFGYEDFILALGYKGQIIKDYFEKNKFPYAVRCVKTGINSNTGARLLKLKKYLQNEKNFMFTYGDGLTNQNLKKLEKFHLKNNKVATMTIVRPPVRFGETKIKGNFIESFIEKPQIKKTWINGGYFVFKKEIFKYLGKYNVVLEKKPLEKLAKKRKLVGFKHKDFWQCIDTPRDKEYVKKLLKFKKAPWINNKFEFKN